MKMKKNFTQIENVLIEATEISDGAFRTYLLLRAYKYGDHKVFPSQSTLAAKRDKSRQTIITHINILKKHGLISSKKRGYSTSNEYIFSSKENYTPVYRLSKESETSNVKTLIPHISKKLYTNNTEDNKTKKKNTNYKRERIKIDEIRLKHPFLNKNNK